MNRKYFLKGIAAFLAGVLWSKAAPQTKEKGGKAMMKRLSKPRIPVLAKEEWTNEQRTLLERFYAEGRPYNVQGTFGQHWEAYKNYYVWATYIMGSSFTLPPRERELLILRTGWLCQ